MSHKTARLIYISLQGFITIALAVAVAMVWLQQLIPGRSQQYHVSYLPAMMLHLLLTLAGTVSALFLPMTSRNEIERDLMPPLFICMALTDIPIVMYLISSGFLTISCISCVARIAIFAVLFSGVLMVYLGLFHLGINTGKIIPFTLLGAAGSLLISTTVPLSIALHPFEPSQWVTNQQLFFLPLLLGMLAIFNYIALYIRERTKHIMFRGLSISLVIVGHLLYLHRGHPSMVWIGIILFILGTVVGIPRGRFSQLQ